MEENDGRFPCSVLTACLVLRFEEGCRSPCSAHPHNYSGPQLLVVHVEKMAGGMSKCTSGSFFFFPSPAHQAGGGNKNCEQQAPLAAPQVSEISVVLRVSIILCGGLGLYSQFVIDLLN